VSRILAAADRLPPRLRRLIKALPGSGHLRRLAVGRPGGPTPEPGTMRPVVYLPTWARWDVMRQRPQFLLEAFAAAGHPVYFIDPREDATRISHGVTIVPSIASVPGEHVILYIHFAPLRDLIDRFADAVVVYDVLDDLAIYEPDELGLPIERTVAHHHPFLVERANHLIVSNPVLLERHEHEHAGTILVANGVDVARFEASAARPADLDATTRPIVGYRGAVGEWFAFDLLEDVARLRPELSFTLVGPIYERVRDRADETARLPNVAFLGERASDDMPAYAQAFDVEAIWFTVNEMTAGVTPLKMYEALAAGTPVVSTALPACTAEPEIRTASDPAAFSSALDDALADASDPSWLERAREAAHAADWSKRLDPLLDRLDAAGHRLVP